MPRGRKKGSSSSRDEPDFEVVGKKVASPPTEVMDRRGLKRAARPLSLVDKGPVINLDDDDDDDDDDVAVVEVQHAPPRTPPAKRGRKPGVTTTRNLPRPVVGPGVDLLMECVDEELSPWQQEANKKAAEEYHKACKEIELARSGNAEVTMDSSGTLTPTAAQVAESPGKGRRPRKANHRAPSPDIIIVDEEPVQEKAIVQVIRSAPPVPSQPLRVQGNQVIVGTPQGVPYFLGQGNVPFQIIGTSPQGAPILARPVTPMTLAGQTVAGMTTPIRPSGSIPVQRVPAQPRGPPVKNTSVRGTGAGAKRAGASTPTASEPPKKQGRAKQNRKSLEEEISNSTAGAGNAGNWVPLDEYYYGKKEGDPAYREEKGEYRFKCWYCHKMLYNNIRIMMHMQGHIDSEKQQNLDLSDLTQCKHCYKQLDTPFEMQQHIERVHQNKSNVLVCRICEKDHDNQGSLRQHMKQLHNACEMPYICQLCNFRSSIYYDVVDHFKKRHDSSPYTMCLYCLKVFKIKSKKNDGWGMTNNFFQHLQKHQAKQTKKKCSSCKLTFFNKQDVKMHKNKDHLPNYKGILGGASSSTTVDLQEKQVMIKVPESGKTVKSLNAPSVSKILDFKGTRIYGLQPVHLCFECNSPMLSNDHFKKYIECSMCRYATTCNNAYSNHMMGFHSGNLQARLRSSYRERPQSRLMYCLCGFTSSKGNVIANHLISCSKRTCYSKKPELRWFEYDDEQEDFNPLEGDDEEPDESPEDQEGSPERDVPSLFGALGLVKKAPSQSKLDYFTKPDKEPDTMVDPSVIVQAVIDDILDTIFPAEAAAGRVINDILLRVDQQTALQSLASPGVGSSEADNIPESLKGSQKWSTVSLKESKKPSKVSIFLGGRSAPWFKGDSPTKGKKGRKDDDKTEISTEPPTQQTTSTKKQISDTDQKPEIEKSEGPQDDSEAETTVLSSTKKSEPSPENKDDVDMKDECEDKMETEDVEDSTEPTTSGSTAPNESSSLSTEDTGPDTDNPPQQEEEEPAAVNPPQQEEEEPAAVNPPQEEEEPAAVNPPQEEEEEPAAVNPPQEEEEPAAVNPPQQEEEEPAAVNPPQQEEEEPAAVNPPQQEEEEEPATVNPPQQEDEDSLPEAVQSLPEAPESEQGNAEEPEESQQADQDMELGEDDAEAATEAEAAPEAESQPDNEGSGSQPEDEANDSAPEDDTPKAVAEVDPGTPLMDEQLQQEEEEDSPPEAEASESKPEADGGQAAEGEGSSGQSEADGGQAPEGERSSGQSEAGTEAESSQRAGESSQRAEESSQRAGESSQRAEESSQRAEDNPEQAENQSRTEADSSQTESESASKQQTSTTSMTEPKVTGGETGADAQPQQTTPEEDETTPEESEATPEEGKPTPEKSKTTPEDCKTTPDISASPSMQSGTPEESDRNVRGSELPKPSKPEESEPKPESKPESVSSGTTRAPVVSQPPPPPPSQTRPPPRDTDRRPPSQDFQRQSPGSRDEHRHRDSERHGDRYDRSRDDRHRQGSSSDRYSGQDRDRGYRDNRDYQDNRGYRDNRGHHDNRGYQDSRGYHDNRGYQDNQHSNRDRSGDRNRGGYHQDPNRNQRRDNRGGWRGGYQGGNRGYY